MKIICAIVLITVLFINGEAKTHIVTTAAEIKSISSSVQPGDTILLKNGEWKDQEIVLKAEGTEAQPIIMKAETNGEVILNGSSKLRLSGSFITVEGLYFLGGAVEKNAVIEFRTSSENTASNCRLTECAIVDYNPEDTELDTKWVSVYGTKNRVDHNYFKGKTNQGTMLVVWLNGEPCGHRIDHNYFGPRPDRDKNGAETIRIGTSDWWRTNARTVVEDNYFYRCNGEVEIISNKSCENVYRRNTFVECAGTLTLRHGDRASVYGNFFFGNKKRNTGGVRIIGEDHKVYNNYFQDLDGDNTYSALPFMQGVLNSADNGYMQVKNAVVVFNTFVNNAHAIVLGVMGSDKKASLPPMNCTIANNLVVTNKGMLLEEKSAPAGMTYLGNIFSNVPSSIISSSMDHRTENIEMAIGADGVFRPAPSSVAIGAARGSFPFVTEDIDGQSRPSRKDVGADQLSTENIKYHPLSPEMVGPQWKLHMERK
ncbi:MAG: polysaccharide lyase 6 family protein [Bacteroidota bacterium]